MIAPVVLVLGTAQDGGVPHAGCACDTCRAARAGAAGTPRRLVASIAIVGHTGRALVVDATPDLPAQIAALGRVLGRPVPGLDGLLLTHAHTGHILGLGCLGREVMDVRGLPLWASASMARYLTENRPWSHLVERGSVDLCVVRPEEPFPFDGLRVTPFLSPHRAEDTDTLGIEIEGPRYRLLYVPDADAFPPRLAARIRQADVALVDGTFYDAGELAGRAIEEIPHPFAAESVRTLAGARGPVFFTHLNHTNRLLDPDPARRPSLPDGFEVLARGERFAL
ncbi:MAG: MBL fold metallo-hydrolase [Planctomycetota bacterium]